MSGSDAQDQAFAMGCIQPHERPLLMVDIDGVISLFGFDAAERPAGSFHWIDGVPHYLSSEVAAHLLDLAETFEMVWCSGWEERADEYLPHLLGLPRGLAHLCFDRRIGRSSQANTHWKLEAIDRFAGQRPLAWIDDAFNESCHAWSRNRIAPTLLIQTSPALGLTCDQTRELYEWASGLF